MAQKTIEDMNRDELETAIICDTDDDLYRKLDEPKFLDHGYTVEELRAILKAWILAAPDTMIETDDENWLVVSYQFNWK